MSLETISTGDELVRGRSVDTNAPWIAEQAAESGVLRVFHTTVGDDPAALADAFRRAARRSDVVVVTGGLGPTEDDHTRVAAAEAAGVDLVEDPELTAWIRERFESRGIPLLPKNLVQAYIPAGAEVLPNPLGTAPGFRLEIDGASLFFLSGVPREMEVMFDAGIRPVLAERGPGGAYGVVVSFGKPEAWVDERTKDLAGTHDLSVGITAVLGTIKLTFQATGPDARERVDAAVGTARERLGDLVLEADTLAGAVGHLLEERGLTLATAESCTGGLVGRLLTDVPGISANYLGGVIAYANEVKEDLLGVPCDLLVEHGAVSAETAEAMAAGARETLGTDFAVSITGIAGPGGGTEEKPVGLVWFGFAGPSGVESLSRRLPGDREVVRGFAANVALQLVRRRLQTAARP
ncbi:MAG: CinA family nicotinamide mononucleotide deamidase-related protein [Planctomycetota bacterium]